MSTIVGRNRGNNNYDGIPAHDRYSSPSEADTSESWGRAAAPQWVTVIIIATNAIGFNKCLRNEFQQTQDW